MKTKISIFFLMFRSASHIDLINHSLLDPTVLCIVVFWKPSFVIINNNLQQNILSVSPLLARMLLSHQPQRNLNLRQLQRFLLLPQHLVQNKFCLLLSLLLVSKLLKIHVSLSEFFCRCSCRLSMTSVYMYLSDWFS